MTTTLRHNAPPPPVAVASPRPGSEELVVTGGPGGTRARLDDLEACAKSLDSAATSLGTAWTVLNGIQQKLDDWSYLPLRPAPEQTSAAEAAQRARIELEPIRSSAHGTRALADDLLDLARQVRSARAQYEESDDFTSKLWGAVGRAFIPGFVHLPPWVWDYTPVLAVKAFWDGASWIAGGDVPTKTMERLARVTAYRASLLTPGFRLLGDDPVPWFAGMLSDRIDAMLPEHEIRALPVIGSRTEAPPPDGFEDLTARLTSLEEADGSASVLVERVDKADGTVAWIVSIPGTQDWGAGGSDPSDLPSNLELMGGRPADSTEAVIDAMRRAGIGKDEPVVLVGHSQGGMVAMDIAAHAGFAVALTMTVGSPVGARTTKATTQTISFEHHTDAVPQFDGKDNPDGPLHTTVKGHARESAQGSASQSHSTEEYEILGWRADQSDDPSIKAWRDEFKEVIGDADVVESRRWKLQRLETAR
ncbi:MAG: alpha/beta fold hydrolase [Actinomycetales bacterium]|nr:alpha/beta fold hydrolase [Actinomycetales bacterium]